MRQRSHEPRRLRGGAPRGCAAMLAALVLLGAPWTAAGQQDNGTATPAPVPVPGLSPTVHPAVPAAVRGMWYAPAPSKPAAALERLARGIRSVDEGSGRLEDALPLLNGQGVSDPRLLAYARYYTGIALQRLNRVTEAEAAFVAAGQLAEGQLPESSTLRRAELRVASGDYAGAVALYQTLLKGPMSWPPQVLLQLGKAASVLGDRATAVNALARVINQYPLAPEAIEAEPLLARANGFALETAAGVAAELTRAETLFDARRWSQAKAAYERVQSRLQSEIERDRVTVRLAQVLVATGQHRAARDVLRRFTAHDGLGAEAQYGLIVAARVLGDETGFIQQTTAFVKAFPKSPLAESALNDLARHYVLQDEDEKAAGVYTQMVAGFPSGAFAERAAWKAGWWAYREKNYAETIRVFEIGAMAFPRSDYRPSWLYWTGRALELQGRSQAAVDRYRLAAADYRNTYYGRLAWGRLTDLGAATVAPNVRRIAEAVAPMATAPLVETLIAAGLYRPALNELQYAQKLWGDSPPLLATIALMHNKLGSLRLGINTMKRAYPQYMAAGGEALPLEILHVLFPIDYWPLLRGHAQARGLDPHVVAALVAQESTFDPQIRSSADAVGLMQIIPSTGRRYASRIGIRGFTTRSLTNPEINVRIGTQYYSELIKRFGAHHLALASYNAGEGRVQRWVNETPGLPQDEFIDNIPFPETQNYVKRILGTADDYRRLYGDLAAQPTSAERSASPAPAVPAPPAAAPATKPPAPVTKPPATTKPATKAPATKTPPKPATAKPPAKKAPTTAPAKKTPPKPAGG